MDGPGTQVLSAIAPLRWVERNGTPGDQAASRMRSATIPRVRKAMAAGRWLEGFGCGVNGLAQVVTQLVETSTEARCGLVTFEVTHRSVSSLDPTMVPFRSDCSDID